jgi:hypothetical protein
MAFWLHIIYPAHLSTFTPLLILSCVSCFLQACSILNSPTTLYISQDSSHTFCFALPVSSSPSPTLTSPLSLTVSIVAAPAPYSDPDHHKSIADLHL